jgi:hypothetical protein
MPVSGVDSNGIPQHWVIIRPEPPGQITAQVLGLPELRATASTREEAMQQVRVLLSQWLAAGQLVPLAVPGPNPLLNFSGHLDPNDLLEQEFVNEMARRHQEDLECTLREDDPECSNSSSTPIT